MTYFTIYKITNLVNGKFYVGKHKTDDLDDEYMGSGSLIDSAIEAYGIENFRKDILEVYGTEREMNLAERILVVLDEEVSYNLCPGGQGGWGYINRHGLGHASEKQRLRSPFGSKSFIEKHHEDFSRGAKRRYEIHGCDGLTFKGRKHREETRNQMSASHRGKHEGAKNSQFGTCWITDGTVNKKVKLTEVDEWFSNGWRKGRITK